MFTPGNPDTPTCSFEIQIQMKCEANQKEAELERKRKELEAEQKKQRELEDLWINFVKPALDHYASNIEVVKQHILKNNTGQYPMPNIMIFSTNQGSKMQGLNDANQCFWNKQVSDRRFYEIITDKANTYLKELYNGVDIGYYRPKYQVLRTPTPRHGYQIYGYSIYVERI